MFKVNICICLFSRGPREDCILKIARFFGKLYRNGLTGIVVISEVVALMYLVLSKAEKHVPYGELVGTTECKTL
jgi:hypothetical protein